MQQWACGGALALNQIWKAVAYGNSFELVSLNSGKCLDVPNGNSNNGTALQQWDCGGGNDSNQLWTLIPISTATVQAQVTVPLPTFTYTCLRNVYVSTSGNDSNSGTVNSPLRTLQAGLNPWPLHQPGDCINVMPGTYSEAVNMNQGGNSNSASGYVVLRAPSGGVLINTPTYAGVVASISFNASYEVIDGLEVAGNVANGGATGACVSGGTWNTHHLAVLNSKVHNCGSSGIQFAYGDYYWAIGNESYGNASTNLIQGSGISVYQARQVYGFNYVSADSAAYHIELVSNRSHDNMESYPCTQSNPSCHTDGNGIVLDDLSNSQTYGAYPAYPFQSLIQANSVWNNGGRGIDVGRTSNAYVIGNIAYGNNQDLSNLGTYRGELEFAINVHNVTAHHNIGFAVPRSYPDVRRFNTAILDASCCNAANNSNNTIVDNLTYSGTAGDPSVSLDTSSSSDTIASWNNQLGVNPNLSNPAVGDFTFTAPVTWLNP